LISGEAEPALEIRVQRGRGCTYDRDVRFDGSRDPGTQSFPGDVVGGRGVESGVVEETVGVVDSEGAGCADTRTRIRTDTTLSMHVKLHLRKTQEEYTS
jgi:hypothetical protein